MELNNPNRIKNKGGKWVSLEGPKAMEVMRLRTVLVGLKAEERGMRLTRHVNCTQLAKQLTGLKTRDRAKLGERIQQMMDQLIGECVVIDQNEVDPT
jgi:hypothetical protein